MTTIAGKVAGQARSLLPDPLFYRGIAAAYRLRPERRLLLLEDLVPRGGVAVDVGGWWGPWTYWLSRRAASVWSFEPNPEMASFLEGVVSANVNVEAVALSNRSGVGTLFAPQDVGRDALATLSATHREESARSIEVPLRTLDSFGLDDVGFMKIDVEGHEFEVLEGAEETIARCGPSLLVEIDQPLHDQPIQRIFDWLLERGYEGRFRRRRSWVALSDFDARVDQPPRSDARSTEYVNDFVFTPGAS